MSLTQEEYYIIEPVEATNEVSHPSVESAAIGLNGYGAHGAGVSIARSSLQQRRGMWSVEVTPATGVESGLYYGYNINEAAGVARTFSVDVKGVAGQVMRVQIRTLAGAMLSETVFTANGYWQRLSVTRTGAANITRKLYVVRDAVASTTKFYVDGLYYSTINGTYLDGDMKGFLKGQTEYRWNGTPHASTSWRSGQSRSGGTMLRIKDYAKIILVLGLGMAPVTNLAVPTANGYSSYQNTLTNNREIIFKLAINGSNPGDVQDKRQALIDAVRPDRTAVKQPLIIRYQGLDAAGGDASEPVDIYAHYTDGLQDGPGQPFYEEPNLRFTQYLPFLSKAGDSGIGLGYQTSVTNFNSIGYRDTDGTWKAMGTGTSHGDPLDDHVIALVSDKYNNIYAGGGFTSAGGVANTNKIAKWDGVSWSALGSGVTGGIFPNWVYDLLVGPDGTLYACGSFTQMGGVANTSRIAKWNGSAWSALGTGANDSIYSMAMGSDGTLYAAGNFTQMSGVANTSYIAKWNGSAWSALGTGLNNMAYRIFYNKGILYAGGMFSQAGGVPAAYVAKWNGSWSAMGAGTDGPPKAFAADPGGLLYVGGEFTTAGGTPANNIAIWNGTGWSTLGKGVNGIVNILKTGPDGRIYAGGQFTAAGGIPLPDRGMSLFGNIWTPLDIDVQDSAATFYAFAWDPMGRFYLGGLWAGTTARSATVTVSSTGNTGSGAYPQIVFTGPGAVWQLKNYTTGIAIYFQNLTLLAGETATLDLMPNRVSFKSSFRGDLINYIRPGSNLKWFLQRGDNNVSAYMTGTTAASMIVMTWQDAYWSKDAAKR
jgi:hypothetical protein